MNMFILTLLFVASVSGKSQGYVDENCIYLIGQITNMHNGAPIENQEIEVVSDESCNPGFIYSNKLYTDKEGFYYDTIRTKIEKGALIVSTEDYLNNKYDTTLYFRFHWSDDNILFGNFQIDVQVPAVSFQANFAYQSNPDGDNAYKYAFINKSIGSNISGWFWDFGDGSYSIEENPVHIYSDHGLKRVILTTKRLAPGSLIEEESSISKIILVRAKGYHSFGGQVFSQYFPIDIGLAYLYEIVDTKLIPVDTMEFDTAWWFYQVLDGEYIVKTDLDPASIHINKFLATYYGDVVQWQEADTIFHDSNSFNYDIDLIPVAEQYLGPGTVSGSIMYDPTGKDGGGPACNMELILYNEDDVPVICSHSNDEGEFDFSQVLMGTYNVHAEVTGKYTFPVQITISQNNLNFDEIQFLINSTSVNGSVSAIDESILNDGISEVYPNPVHDIAMIDLDLPEMVMLEVEIYSMTGQLIHQIQIPDYLSQGQIRIDVADLPSGMYYLNIFTGDTKIIRKFIR